jgi:hypothetical protein
VRIVGLAAGVALAAIIVRLGYLLYEVRVDRRSRWQVLRVSRPELEALTHGRRPKRSVIPAGARPEPGDEPCVSLGHTGLGYREEIERVRWGVRSMQIVEAVCLDCDRPQSQVRIVYPADRVITVGRGDDQMAGADTR